jgi:hypothetical protein
MDAGNSDRTRGLKPWPKGISGNPAGRPKVISAIQEFLDAEHRTVEQVRPVLAKLRSLAIEGTEKGIYWEGAMVATEIEYNPSYMKLYLERVIGAVPRATDDAAIAETAKALLDAMIADAKARRGTP